MRRILLMCVAVALLASLAAAAPLCRDLDRSTLTSLTSLPTEGNDVGCVESDKLFFGFTYSGGGGIDETEVSWTVSTQNFPVTGSDLHVLTFTPDGAWVQSVSITYSIAVYQPVTPRTITQVSLGYTSTLTADSSVVTLAYGGTSPLQADATNGRSATATGLDRNQVNVTVTGTPDFVGINSITNTFVESYDPVPEPGTLALIGCGLLAVALWKRR